MTKQELIYILSTTHNKDVDELNEMTTDGLKELLEDLEDLSDLFPNEDNPLDE